MFHFFKKEKKYEEINVNELDDLIGRIELIDVREGNEFEAGSLKTAQNIPMLVLLQTPDKFLTKDKTYYILCQSGMRSKRAVKTLAEQGYRVVNVVGGMKNYQGKNKK